MSNTPKVAMDLSRYRTFHLTVLQLMSLIFCATLLVTILYQYIVA